MARQRILPVFVPHLGCPHDCVFCNQRRISGSSVPASGADVTAILQKARAGFPAGATLAFYGGSFTAIHPALQEELLGAAQPFLQDGTIRAIRLSTRPDAIDGDVLRRLRHYGVETVELGAQSMDDRVLYESGRGHTAADTERAVSRLREEGFSVILQMMTGLPGSSRTSDLQTAERIIGLHPDGVRIYPTVVVKNTPLEDLWRAGLYEEHTVEAAVDVCAEILPKMEAAGIPVIRLGLNPTEELSREGAVAGAYHPALGELVRSEILLRRGRALLKAVPKGAFVTLGVAPERVSAMTGQKRRNVELLTAEFALSGLKIRGISGAGEEIILVDGDEFLRYTIFCIFFCNLRCRGCIYRLSKYRASSPLLIRRRSCSIRMSP